MNEDEKLIDQKTAAFLQQASNLVSSNLNLAADLAVTRCDYGHRPLKNEYACKTCCLSVLSNRLSVHIRKNKWKRPTVLASKCSFCGKQQASMIIKRATKVNKSKNVEDGTEEGASDEEMSEISHSSVSTKREDVSSVAPSPKPTTILIQPKKRAKTLSKLASLNDEKNRISGNGGAGTSSLLSFMNSLKR